MKRMMCVCVSAYVPVRFNGWKKMERQRADRHSPILVAQQQHLLAIL